MIRPFLPALALLSLFALAGCNSMPRFDGARTGPFYVPLNVHADARLPAEVRRIVILPCAADGPPLAEATLDSLDASLRTELIPAARAEISPLSRDAIAQLCGRRQFVSTTALPANFLSRLANETGADAVIFVDVTAYSPYPPLTLGLRAKLVDLKSGALLWAFDNLFPSADESVANSARRHFLVSTGSTVTPADMSYTVLQNPSRFANYVAAATWATLPAR